MSSYKVPEELLHPALRTTQDKSHEHPDLKESPNAQQPSVQGGQGSFNFFRSYAAANAASGDGTGNPGTNRFPTVPELEAQLEAAIKRKLGK